MGGIIVYVECIGVGVVEVEECAAMVIRKVVWVVGKEDGYMWCGF